MNDLAQIGLYLASALGDQDGVEITLGLGAHIHATGGRHSNSLHLACIEGQFGVAKLLLEKGADARSCANFSSALQASMPGGNEGIALLILERAFQVGSQDTCGNVSRETAQADHVRD